MCVCVYVCYSRPKLLYRPIFIMPISIKADVQILIILSCCMHAYVK